MTKKSRPIASTTTLTALTSLLAATQSNAAIEYFGPDSSFSANLGGSNVFWDIDDDSTDDAVFRIFNTFNDLDVVGASGAVFSGMVNGANLINRATGYVVSASRAFDTAIEILYSGAFRELDGWTSGVPGYFGFRFDSDGVKFGWAQATITANTGITIHEWAYDDSGASIEVGAIPEPSTAAGLGALALGAAGLRRWRKQKTA